MTPRLAVQVGKFIARYSRFLFLTCVFVRAAADAINRVSTFRHSAEGGIKNPCLSVSHPCANHIAFGKYHIGVKAGQPHNAAKQKFALVLTEESVVGDPKNKPNTRSNPVFALCLSSQPWPKNG